MLTISGKDDADVSNSAGLSFAQGMIYMRRRRERGERKKGEVRGRRTKEGKGRGGR